MISIYFLLVQVPLALCASIICECCVHVTLEVHTCRSFLRTPHLLLWCSLYPPDWWSSIRDIYIVLKSSIRARIWLWSLAEGITHYDILCQIPLRVQCSLAKGYLVEKLYSLLLQELFHYNSSPLERIVFHLKDHFVCHGCVDVIQSIQFNWSFSTLSNLWCVTLLINPPPLID